MKTIILTSGFPDGFTKEFNNALVKHIDQKSRFALIASDFENNHDKTDRYCKQWLQWFYDCGIQFNESFVVDSRMAPDVAQKIIASADVLWLSGGHTLAQMNSIRAYGLIPAIRKHNGVIIGMSAGSINMAKTAICIPYQEQAEVEVYKGIGLVDISVEPHYKSGSSLDEMMEITNDYPLYGLCDEGFIVVCDNEVAFSGDVFYIEEGMARQISFAIA